MTDETPSALQVGPGFEAWYEGEYHPAEIMEVDDEGQTVKIKWVSDGTLDEIWSWYVQVGGGTPPSAPKEEPSVLKVGPGFEAWYQGEYHPAEIMEVDDEGQTVKIKWVSDGTVDEIWSWYVQVGGSTPPSTPKKKRIVSTSSPVKTKKPVKMTKGTPATKATKAAGVRKKPAAKAMTAKKKPAAKM